MFMKLYYKKYEYIHKLPSMDYNKMCTPSEQSKELIVNNVNK